MTAQKRRISGANASVRFYINNKGPVQHLLHCFPSRFYVMEHAHHPPFHAVDTVVRYPYRGFPLQFDKNYFMCKYPFPN